MNGTNFLSSASLPAITDVDWQLRGIEDYNMDGNPDLVWRYFGATPGSDSIWYMDGTNHVSGGAFTAVTDTAWQILGPK